MSHDAKIARACAERTGLAFSTVRERMADPLIIARADALKATHGGRWFDAIEAALREWEIREAAWITAHRKRPARPETP